MLYKIRGITSTKCFSTPTKSSASRNNCISISSQPSKGPVVAIRAMQISQSWVKLTQDFTYNLRTTISTSTVISTLVSFIEELLWMF